MQKTVLTVAAASGALAVALGAMGAHALKTRITADQLVTYETAVKYQMYHSLALVLVALLMDKMDTRLLNYSSGLFMAGILFFSGSVYLLSMRDLLGIANWTFLGPITPLGGLCFISGWILLLLAALKLKS